MQDSDLPTGYTLAAGSLTSGPGDDSSDDSTTDLKAASKAPGCANLDSFGAGNKDKTVAHADVKFERGRSGFYEESLASVSMDGTAIDSFLDTAVHLMVTCGPFTVTDDGSTGTATMTRLAVPALGDHVVAVQMVMSMQGLHVPADLVEVRSGQTVFTLTFTDMAGVPSTSTVVGVARHALARIKSAAPAATSTSGSV